MGTAKDGDMKQRLFIFAMLLIPAFALFTGANSEEETPPSNIKTNNALVLPNPVTPSVDQEAVESQKPDDDEAEATQDVTAPALPPEESKSLGVPNGMFSTRPVSTSPGESTRGLSSLDPRTNELVRILIALAAVVGLLFLLRPLLKRTAGGWAAACKPSGILEVLARYPAGRNQQFLILKWGRRIVLLHRSGTSMTTLGELTDPEEVAGFLARMEGGVREKDARRFRSLMQEHLQPNQQKHGDYATEVHTSGENQIVDLTRRPGRGLGGWLSRRKGAA